MSQRREPINDDAINAYLDGRMDPSAREAFEARLRDDTELQELLAIESQIDESLSRLFPADEPSEEQLAAVIARAAAAGKLSFWQRYWRVAALSAAAAVAWVVVFWQMQAPEPIEPVFAARPLVDIYHDVVDEGFIPYYECDDMQRFAATFEARQGEPLHLLPMPIGSGMLGLSYVGGLSRDTTAMLSLVDEQPVMVFVDQATSDSVVADEENDPGLQVFREERLGLLFYEVSPFSESRMIEYFAEGYAEPQSEPAAP